MEGSGTGSKRKPRDRAEIPEKRNRIPIKKASTLSISFGHPLNEGVLKKLSFALNLSAKRVQGFPYPSLVDYLEDLIFLPDWPLIDHHLFLLRFSYTIQRVKEVGIRNLPPLHFLYEKEEQQTYYLKRKDWISGIYINSKPFQMVDAGDGKKISHLLPYFKELLEELNYTNR